MIDLEIHEVVDRETRAWNEKSVELLLSVFHPEMVWVWPTDPKNHDPISWTSVHGKFDRSRWTASYVDWFSTFDLIHNVRKTQRVFVSPQGDGAFAIVDVDTLWRSATSEESHWLGRTCKTYVKTAHGWKMLAQVGVLDFRSEQTRLLTSTLNLGEEKVDLTNRKDWMGDLDDDGN